MRSRDRARRAGARTAQSFGKRRTEWGKHALAAYTWTRTDRGPLQAWLHHIGKSDDPSCPCGARSQNGAHVAFHCPRLQAHRERLLPEERTWAGLDDPHWVTEAGGNNRQQEKIEGTEAFFHDVYWFLKRRNEEDGGGP